MIDTHCHLLPGLDDGPANDWGSVELARALVAQGVRGVVCTPHFSPRFPTSLERGRERLAALRRSLGALAIGLQVTLAAEVDPRLALTIDAAELGPRAIAGRFLLVELVGATTPADVDAVVERTRALGLVPVLAHPERCRAVQRDLRVATAAREGGALLQVVAPSLAEGAGGPVSAAAGALLDQGAVDVVGSDAHGGGRRLRLAQARATVAERLGPGAWERLTDAAPRSLLAGDDPRG